MQKMVLNRLEFSNFKAAKYRVIDFSTVLTKISGRNEEGKSTVLDGFLWNLFGVDSFGRSDYEIRPLDGNNNPIEHTDCSVKSWLTLDGKKTVLHRVYVEKWEKPTNQPLPVYRGQTTKYWINDVPKSATEYKNFVFSLIDQELFKLLTSVSYFVSLKEDERRRMLLTIAGEISTDDIIAEITDSLNPDHLRQLVEELNSGKDLAEYRKQVQSQIKKINDDLRVVPENIKEAKLAIPVEQDYDKIEKDIEDETAKIADFDILISNKSKAEKQRQQQTADMQKSISKLKTSIFELKEKRQTLEFSIKSAYGKKKTVRDQEIADLKTACKANKSMIEDLHNANKIDLPRIEEATRRQTTLMEEWKKLNAEKFEMKDSDINCPSCLQPLPADMLNDSKAKLEANFNSNKTTRINQINEDGKTLATGKAAVKARIDARLVKISALIETVNADSQKVADLELAAKSADENDQQGIQQDIDTNKDHQAIEAKILVIEGEVKEIEKKIADFEEQSPEADETIVTQKRESQHKILSLTKTLGGKAIALQQKKRVADLEEKIVTLSNELTEKQGLNFAIEQFENAKMDTLEHRVNGMFNYVTFRMFKKLVDGTRTPCCDPLINGVPFMAANTAARINAGLDIINVFGNFNKIHVPVFVDNAEAINRLHSMESQLIGMYVTTGDFTVEQLG